MKNILIYSDLILYQVLANLRSEAKRYYISYLWWIINPVVDMVVFYIVFSVVLSREIENFVPFLLIGIITWRWLSTTLTRSSNSILANAQLINQVYIPKIILPTVVICTETFKFFIALLILFGFLWIYGFSPSHYYLSLPFLLLVELIIIVSVSYLFAFITPFFPDIQIVLQSLIRLFFFLSGIFYNIDNFPEKYKFWFYLNPMAFLIKSYRSVIMYEQWPNFVYIFYIFLIGTILACISSGLINKFDKQYPRIVMS